MTICVSIMAAVYGFGIAVTMYWLFHSIAKYVPVKQMTKDIMQVLGTLLGSGGVLAISFKTIQLPSSTAVPHMNGLATLAALAGFGLGATIIGLKTLPKSTTRLYRDFADDADLHVLLMGLEYNKSLAEISSFLNISVAAANRRNLAAFRKIV